MAERTNDDWQAHLPAPLLDFIAGRKIDEVECVVPDFAGVARGKAIPAKKFSLKDRSFLPISMFYITIAGTYAEHGSGDEDWLTERDMVLRPDMTTATAVPWADEPTMQVINDLEDVDGTPISLAPRNVLKRVIAEYRAMGLEPVVAPEMEFYLTSPNVDPNDPIEPPVGRTGRRGIGRQAYSIAAVDEYGPVIDDIYEFADAQGLGIDAITQEDGAGQIEINLQHGDPLRLADQVFYFKRSIREAALLNGCFATFMAKPMKNEPGSAMHIHQSVLNSVTRTNAFTDENGEATEMFHAFIAGLQTYLPHVLLLMAPYVNSYRRFGTDTAAPGNFEWDTDNRTAGIRIPISEGWARRVENRISGMDANPYLAIAGNLAAGLLGIRNKLKPKERVGGPTSQVPQSDKILIPRAMTTALSLFEENEELRALLGEDFCRIYQRLKEHELNEFLSEISAWEREHLLLNV
ncbi:MAG: glutamine synthetase family protein [Pseudomonadota bacterium]